MIKKYNTILSDWDFFSKLSKSEISLYLYLLGDQTYFSDENGITPLSQSNKELGELLGRNPSTISRQLQVLRHHNLITISYVPNKNGTKRYIEVIKVRVGGNV